MTLPRQFGVTGRITPTRQQPAGVAIPEGVVISNANEGGAGHTYSVTDLNDSINGDLDTFGILSITYGTCLTTTWNEYVIDLGTWYRLKSIFGTLFGDSSETGTANVRVYVSEDNLGTNWTEVGTAITVANQAFGHFNENNSGNGWDNIRFIRLRFELINAKCNPATLYKMRIYNIFASAV